MPLPTILTGDRPTGPLHIGHYAGSLAARLQLQDSHSQFLLIADLQALTDNAGNPTKVRDNVLEVALDYLAVGLERSTICLQSALPPLPELTMLYMNHVTVSRLERNPTIRDEIASRGFGRDIPAGFLCYPVSQAADITAFRAGLVPVGEDQAPLLELARDVACKVNRMAGKDLLPLPQAMTTATARLPGIDGKSKMSKSGGNALFLKSSPEEIRAAVRAMYTDPNHIRASDPGTVEGNVVFACLDAFDPDPACVAEMKARYRAGGLGDGKVKARLEEVLQEFLAPIRARREVFAADKGEVLRLLREGTEVARQVTGETLAEVRAALGVFALGEAG